MSLQNILLTISMLFVAIAGIFQILADIEQRKHEKAKTRKKKQKSS